jgi:hypothetical protein
MKVKVTFQRISGKGKTTMADYGIIRARIIHDDRLISEKQTPVFDVQHSRLQE